MRLGGFVFGQFAEATDWAAAHAKAGYTAAYWPLGDDATETEIDAYVAAAGRAGLVIAEVGAWNNNPVSRDESERRRSIEACARRLDLADRVGARCCVNVAGSLGPKWDGPFEGDLTEEAFDLVVESVRAIIDAATPKRSFYTLEPMPWMFPHSPDSYLALVEAVDRPAFGVHLDPCNMINSPPLLFRNGEFLRECFRALGPLIKSCHAKDLRMSPNFTTHIDEAIPGRGCLDYRAFIAGIESLGTDLPLMVEHLGGEAEYREASDYIRSVARTMGVEA